MCEPTAIIGAATSVMGFMAESQAVSERNRAKKENWIRQNKEYDVQANLEDVKYLNDVSESRIQNDLIYQAMLNQWSDNDLQLDRIFSDQDLKIEEAIIEMHANDYAGTQTGATAARRAAAPVREMGMVKSRSLHEKMFAVKESKLKKEQTWHEASNKQWRDFMDNIAFAPRHGFRPASPQYERGPSPASMILGIAGAADDAGMFD